MDSLIKMPSIKQNNRVDRSRLVGGGRGKRDGGKNPIGPDAHELPHDESKFPMPAPPPFIGNPSQFFLSSLPGIAASYDQFQRQFYGRTSLPTQRIFIPNIE